jgi:hypothetical protein
LQPLAYSHPCIRKQKQQEDKGQDDRDQLN